MGICFSWSLLSIFLPCKPETTYKGTSYPQGWLVPLSTTGLGVALTFIRFFQAPGHLGKVQQELFPREELPA